MQNRFILPVNLKQFSKVNQPICVGPAAVTEFPDQYILRMLIKSPYSKGLQLTSDTQWVSNLIQQAVDFQEKSIGIRHPYCYLTVRSIAPKSVAAHEWHVDGFSVRYNHLPEANYVVVLGEYATEYADQSFDFPQDFNPLIHNVHRFFQKRININSVKSLMPWTLYFMDPYVVHKRPAKESSQRRCFIRISFTPIEIPDVNNTVNPLISTSHYNYDGIKDFRDSLKDYDYA